MITIDSVEPGTKFVTTAVLHKDSKEPFLKHFGASRDHCYVWGCKPEDIVDVECEIVENDVLVDQLLRDKNYDNDKKEYFACISVEDDGTLDVGIVEPNIKVFFMCFPYGCDAERFWGHEIRDIYTNEIIHKVGDRRNYMVTLKVKML